MGQAGTLAFERRRDYVRARQTSESNSYSSHTTSFQPPRPGMPATDGIAEKILLISRSFSL